MKYEGSDCIGRGLQQFVCDLVKMRYNRGKKSWGQHSQGGIFQPEVGKTGNKYMERKSRGGIRTSPVDGTKTIIKIPCQWVRNNSAVLISRNVCFSSANILLALLTGEKTLVFLLRVWKIKRINKIENYWAWRVYMKKFNNPIVQYVSKTFLNFGKFSSINDVHFNNV